MENLGIIVLVVAVIAAVVFVLRRLRQREIDRFRQSDTALLEEMRRKAGLTPAGGEDGEPALRTAGGRGGAQLQPSPVAGDVTVADSVLEPGQLALLRLLERELAEDFCVLPLIPLQQVIPAAAWQVTLSFVICDRRDLAPRAAIVLERQDAPLADRKRLLKLMNDAGLPLVSFLAKTRWQVDDVREPLQSWLRTVVARDCPRCGQPMVRKNPATGKNAGKSFWVCRTWPACKGVIRIETRR